MLAVVFCLFTSGLLFAAVSTTRPSSLKTGHSRYQCLVCREFNIYLMIKNKQNSSTERKSKGVCTRVSMCVDCGDGGGVVDDSDDKNDNNDDNDEDDNEPVSNADTANVDSATAHLFVVFYVMLCVV